ncbi:MAG: holo-ACP synthase [Corynebacterium sp.]|uniref:holo-ACP synthase AcpS n=1 Tax=Corynebacterium sp. TaxID=1720 RepID=UPI0026DB9C7F|nr:holo-ACP synthase [Corynebacterium sp.]MDO5099538.1 holo-ACP synthase [Corynebacterium sp.]
MSPTPFVGIDLVHIPSFAEQLAQPGSRFESVFSPLELRIAATKPRRAEHLAGRWAAKEAFIKAWGQSRYGAPPVISPEEVNWAEIQVTPDRWGRTQIVLTGKLASHVTADVITVSISHDGDYATAICVL